MNTFGENLKFLRIRQNLTQTQLADNFNILYSYSFNKTSICQFEHNKRLPELSALINFAEYFNVSLDYLLGLNFYNPNSSNCINELVLEDSFTSDNYTLDNDLKNILLNIEILIKSKTLIYNTEALNQSQLEIINQSINMLKIICSNISNIRYPK